MSKTSTVGAGRVVGFALGTVMVVYLSANEGVWEADNPFLVPDVVMGVLLLASSSLPRRWAVPAMIFAFGWTAGILMVTVFNYLIRGQFAVPNLAMAVAAAMGAVLLVPGAATRWSAVSG